MEENSNSVENTKKRSRELPPGYICKACGEGGHAIYDCPLKISKKKKVISAPVVKRVKLFLSGLPKTMTENDLSKWLRKSGCNYEAEVSIAIDKDNSELSRGFGFLQVKEVEANHFLSLNETKYKNATIKIQMDNKKPEKKGPACYRCGKFHEVASCTNNRICYRCKSSDHLSSECPRRKPKS